MSSAHKAHFSARDGLSIYNKSAVLKSGRCEKSLKTGAFLAVLFRGEIKGGLYEVWAGLVFALVLGDHSEKMWGPIGMISYSGNCQKSHYPSCNTTNTRFTHSKTIKKTFKSHKTKHILSSSTSTYANVNCAEIFGNKQFQEKPSSHLPALHQKYEAASQKSGTPNKFSWKKEKGLQELWPLDPRLSF